MKQYRITKIIFAESMELAIKAEKKAEIVEITLNEEIKNNRIGFK